MAYLMFIMSCVLGLACGAMLTRALRTRREARRAARDA